MQSHAVAVKAVIENSQGQFLVLRRSTDSPHQGGEWDVPGGRIDPGEGPQEALERECTEESGLYVTVGKPIGVHHFTRDDGQVIVMIIFYCKTNDTNVVLSEEHDQFEWVDKDTVKGRLTHMGYAVDNI